MVNSSKRLVTTTQLVSQIVVKINDERAIKWLNDGAQPTDTVKDLFKKFGVYEKLEEAKK